MNIQFLGQNCFLIQYNGKNILTDPFYNYQKEKSGFDIKSQSIDYLLITHAHADHTADVREVLDCHPEVTIIGQPEICGYFDHTKNIDLNIGGSTTIDGLEIVMVQAVHTSSFSDGSYGGVASGYMLRVENKCVYLAGDTGIMAEMSLFPTIFGDIAKAILPIGGHYTMDASQASIAATLLGTKEIIGCHFDTFPPISINHKEASKCFEDKGVSLKIPNVGEKWELLNF